MRNTHKTTSTLIFAASLMLGATAFAHSDGSRTNAQTTASAEKSNAAYPLTTCIVSGDKLDSPDMGPTIDYIHKEEGKPDRLVRLCCKPCVRQFKQDPEKYLALLDDAAAGKVAETAPTAAAHSGHKH